MMSARKTVRTGGKQQRPAPVVVRRPVLPTAPPKAVPPAPVAKPKASPAASPYANARERSAASARRVAERAIALLAPREAEVVARIVAAGGGAGAPWRADMVKAIADAMGVTRRTFKTYLMALRRTLGRSVPFKAAVSGPMLRDDAWIAAAMESGNWGPFQPLVGPGWPGYWEPGPPAPGDLRSPAPRYPTRRAPASVGS